MNGERRRDGACTGQKQERNSQRKGSGAQVAGKMHHGAQGNARTLDQNKTQSGEKGWKRQKLTGVGVAGSKAKCKEVGVWKGGGGVGK